MPTSQYAFVTHWRFDAPIEAVWNELHSPLKWPEWWRGVLLVEKLEAGDASGLGSVHRLVMRSALPYRLDFVVRTVRLERPSIIEGRSRGELVGTGRWTLTSESASTTTVRYDWNVEATKWWMRRLAPIARPLFEWNHDVIMRWGEDGLRRRLGRANVTP